MTIIIRVAAGTRPPVQPVSHEWPNETQHMAELMRRCWDQDPEKRPSFSGTSRKWENGHRVWQRALQRYADMPPTPAPGGRCRVGHAKEDKLGSLYVWCCGGHSTGTSSQQHVQTTGSQVWEGSRGETSLGIKKVCPQPAWKKPCWSASRGSFLRFIERVGVSGDEVWCLASKALASLPTFFSVCRYHPGYQLAAVSNGEPHS